MPSTTTTESASRRAACPRAATSVGGASSIWSEPNRLVWPSVAVAFAGSSTSPLSSIVTSACQPCRSIFVMWPTFTSPDPDAGIRLDVVHVGHLRLNRERPRPLALDTRQRKRVQPSPAGTAGQHPGQHDYDGRLRETPWPASWSHPGRHHQPLQAVGRIRRDRRLRRQRRTRMAGAGGAPSAGGGACRREQVAAERNPAASSPRCR